MVRLNKIWSNQIKSLTILLFGAICKSLHPQHIGRCVDKRIKAPVTVMNIDRRPANACVELQAVNVTKKREPTAGFPRTKMREKQKGKEMEHVRKPRNKASKFTEVNHWVSKMRDTGESEKR